MSMRPQFCLLGWRGLGLCIALGLISLSVFARPLPEFEKASREVLSLPIFPELPTEKQRFVDATLKAKP